MEAIKTTTNRIHPLMATAAGSVIVLSLVGTAAITGILPSSNSAPQAQPAALTSSQASPAYAGALAPAAAPGVPMVAGAAAQGAQPVPVGYTQQGAPIYAQAPAAMYAQPAMAAEQPAPAPVVIKETKTIIKEVPAKHVVHHPRAAQSSYASRDPYYEPAPAPRPAPQPNYMAIGTGAVVGGLLGNQVGSGNGRKLATVAGIIGGGYLGNQYANQNR
jgi:uncharacterized protein YcfJ